MMALNQQLGQLIETQREALATAIVDQQWRMQPELTGRYGAIGQAKCVQDVKYNLAYLAQAITVASPSLFADYIAWVQALFGGLNIPVEDLATSLKISAEVLAQRLPGNLGVIATDYIEAGVHRLSQAPATQPPFITPDQPLASLAQQYLAALLRGERQEASRLILGAVADNVAIKDIYLYVFQRAQREIGRLWHMNQIGVGQEHYCTAATQLIMSQLYPYIFAAERIGRTLVATGVSGELHEIGMRIIADFFEMAGWDTFYLGTNTPAASIVQTIVDRKADILGISVTITFNITALVELIRMVRACETCRHVKILVGGYPFNVEPNLWQQVEADAYAADASVAIGVANRLMAS
jgi:methanogenic corrinoid protein MtbC1